MRIQLLAILLLAGAAAPAAAQDNRIDRRVGKLEQEMRAVQRRVFPGGNVEPEIVPDAGLAAPAGVPGGSAVADLTARVDALEAQLATLTGQAEQNGFRLRQLEESLASFRRDAEGRLSEIERGNAPAAAPVAASDVPAEPDAGAAETAGSAAPATGDPAEDAYLTGFRLWEAGRHAEAQQALDAMARRYPRHRRASYAANLAGRAALDADNPAAAAKLLLANYQANPKGERAADSLFFLGEALVRLKRPADACKVYDELQDVYGAGLRDFVAQRLPKARADANCT